MNRTFSPPQLAKRYGCKVNKIHHWIRAGELQAVNVASRPDGQPRWRISEESLAAFELRRASQPTPKPSRRRQTQAPGREWF